MNWTSTPPSGDCALLMPVASSIWIDVRKASGCHLPRTYATARCAIAGTSPTGHWTCPGRTWLAAALRIGVSDELRVHSISAPGAVRVVICLLPSIRNAPTIPEMLPPMIMNVPLSLPAT